MKKLLLIVGILAFAVPAFASVDVKESMSVPYLRNYGYSDATNRYVQMEKAMHNGKVFYTTKDLPDPATKYNSRNRVWNGIVNGTRSFFNYTDPSLDKGSFWDKDIKFYSSTSDTY